MIRTPIPTERHTRKNVGRRSWQAGYRWLQGSKPALRRLRRWSNNLLRWWRHYDRRWHWWWRVGNVLVVAVLLAGIIVPIAQQSLQASRYKLSAATLNLVGKTDPALTKQLTYNAKIQAYQFNQAALASDPASSNPIAQMQAQVGTASGKGKDKSLYALSVPQDFSRGVTYHDVNTQLSFSLVPQFSGLGGKIVNGHLVYPLAGAAQAIYTLKNNGLKEDIVVQQATTDTMTFSYNLDLPKTLEAKTIPDGNGAIGIYSADPTLFGNINFGSDSKDQAKIMKARENSPKNHLVFGLPSPVIKDMHGNSVGSARFQLDGNNLSIIASDLQGIKTPFTIDPSVVITSASDFQTGGNNEGMITLDTTNNQITRGGLTGGSVGNWTQQSSKINGYQRGNATVAANGYVYFVCGYSSSDSIYRVVLSINADGSLTGIGNDYDDCNNWGQAVVYDGYLYSLGGGSAHGSSSAGVAYAKIDPSTGVPGTWQDTTSMPDGRRMFAATAYNGYLYVVGGDTNTAEESTDVEYAPIKADGSLGNWVSATTLSTARKDASAVAYNGYLYVTGGYTGSSYLNSVGYAKIKSDGSLGSWTPATSFTNGRYGHASTVYNGYLYVLGGTNASVNYNDAQYAQINANGSLGPWQTTTSFTSGRAFFGGAAYDGHLYIVAGSTYDASTNYNDAQYAKIDPAGVTGNYATTTSLPTAREGVGSVAYNGYLYVLGGYSTTYLNDVQYAPINSDGTIGTWQTTTSFTTGREFYAPVLVYNGYLYIVGGSGSSGTLADVQYAPINANGSVGTWQATTSLTNYRNGASVAVYNGYLYIMGGGYSYSVYYDVQYAQINSNGSIGAWQTNATSLGSITEYGTAVAYNGYMYVMGGYYYAYYNDVEYAPINADGSVGTWQATTSLTTGREEFSAVAHNGYLYVMGGSGSSGNLNDVQYAPINSDGTIGTWQSTVSFTTGRFSFGAVAYNGYMYIIGGEGSSSLSDVQYAPINDGGSGTVNGSWTTNSITMTQADNSFGSIAYKGYLYYIPNSSNTAYAPINSNGTVGAWTTTNGPDVTNNWPAVVAYNGYIYVMGYGVTDTVWYAPVETNGSLGTWKTTTSFNTAREGPAAAAYHGYMYIYGGGTVEGASANGSLDDVQYAPIHADGTLGDWTTSANTFTTARQWPGGFANDGYLYVLGGANSSNVLNDVQYAPINSDGSLGVWKTTTSFATARSSLMSYVYNGYAYIVGGLKGTAAGGPALSDTQYAPINANGTLGTWQSTASITTGRYAFGGGVYNGYLYIMGGYDGSNLNDIQYASLNTIARTGHYSKLIDLGSAVNVTGVTYSGSLPGNSAIAYRAAGSGGVFGDSQPASAITGIGGCNGNVQNTRYLLLSVTLDDSQSGTFPDASAANLTDITVNYSPVHPPPNIRLRLGQTLQQGNISPLDTCSS